MILETRKHPIRGKERKQFFSSEEQIIIKQFVTFLSALYTSITRHNFRREAIYSNNDCFTVKIWPKLQNVESTEPYHYEFHVTAAARISAYMSLTAQPFEEGFRRHEGPASHT